jgi:quinol monooxygenase YgiN
MSLSVDVQYLSWPQILMIRIKIIACKRINYRLSEGGTHMTKIATDQQLVTLVNVFTVEPEHQQRLVDLLIEATTAVMNKLPGYISANIHKSLDGTHVVNYAQWRSREDFEAMLRDPEAQKHMQEAYRIASKIEPHLYTVAFVDEAVNA